MANVFAALVGGRSWDWLRELCRPLGLEPQLVDAPHTPLLPPERTGSGERSLRELLVLAHPALSSAVAAALSTGRPQSLKLEDADVVCAPLLVDGRAVGGLVLARPAGPRTRPGPAPVSAEQFASVSAWLAGAVEHHLSSSPVGPDNLPALHKVLQQTVQGGSDRDLVAVFAEALAVWHDIEAVGYVETSPGVFNRAVSLAGRVGTDRALVFPPQSLPPERKMTRLPQSDIDGLDGAGSGDVLVTRLSRGDAPGAWLLMMAGAIDGCDVQVLQNYVSALDMAVALATADSRTRMAMELSRRLSMAGDLTAGLEAALGVLRDSTAAHAAVLALEAGTRRTILHAGPAEALSKAGDTPDRPRLVLRKAMRDGRDATLGLTRTENRPFTPLEHSVASVAADLLTDWAARAPSVEVDDGGGAVFGRTIERLAGEALERGLAVTAVVVATTGPSASAAQAWVDELRRHMRQSDTVGVLQPGELGLLLPDTTAAHANAVARRLRAALDAPANQQASIKSIGFATRMPGQGAAEGILRDAREDAHGRANGGSRAGQR